MIFVLALVLSFALVLGLFFIFIRKIIIWGSYKFAGKEQTEKTITFLQTPLGKTFLWRQRAKGIFYILLIFYIVIGITEPKILNYFPLYILAIPLVLSFILTILMTIFSHRPNKQGDEVSRTITQEENNRYFRWARILHVLLLFAIMIYAGIIYGWSDVHFSSQNNYVLHVITIIAVVLGILCLVWGFSLPKLMTKNYKSKLKGWLNFSSNYSGPEGGLFAIYIVRGAMFVAVAVYGLALGILGVGWQISSPFFVVSAAALILTFPTPRTWKGMLDKFRDDGLPDIPE